MPPRKARVVSIVAGKVYQQLPSKATFKALADKQRKKAKFALVVACKKATAGLPKNSKEVKAGAAKKLKAIAPTKESFKECGSAPEDHQGRSGGRAAVRRQEDEPRATCSGGGFPVLS